MVRSSELSISVHRVTQLDEHAPAFFSQGGREIAMLVIPFPDVFAPDLYVLQIHDVFPFILSSQPYPLPRGHQNDRNPSDHIDHLTARVSAQDLGLLAPRILGAALNRCRAATRVRAVSNPLASAASTVPTSRPE
jgi:hypothetical protein